MKPQQLGAHEISAGGHVFYFKKALFAADSAFYQGRIARGKQGDGRKLLSDTARVEEAAADFLSEGGLKGEKQKKSRKGPERQEGRV